jgi:hypothetical protein
MGAELPVPDADPVLGGEIRGDQAGVVAVQGERDDADRVRAVVEDP